jgi:predicted DNA-binding transcriptional regulator YafY
VYIDDETEQIMPNTATRLIHLIQLLQHQPNQKAAHLAAELGVSVRTLHRYFSMLDEMGIPIYAERGPHGGFSLVRGYKMPPLVFSPEEAVAVSLGTGLVEEMWGQIYSGAARSALAKLENLLPDEQRGEVAWARRTLVSTGLHRSDLDELAPTLEKLRRAARQHRCVQMTYQSTTRPHPTQRHLDPYALVHRWGWWYVIGYCHLRGAVRTFRIDRIVELALLEDTFVQPPQTDFDLHAYLDDDATPRPQISVRMRFAPEGADLARQSQSYWETLEEEGNGSVVVTFPAPNLEWAASTALAYGPLVEVLEPLALREMVHEWASAAAAQYQTRTPDPG